VERLEKRSSLSSRTEPTVMELVEVAFIIVSSEKRVLVIEGCSVCPSEVGTTNRLELAQALRYGTGETSRCR
jgi:hypothetical protein